MAITKQGRYFRFLVPVLIIIDILILINILKLYHLNNVNNFYILLLYITISWLIISFKNKFYNTRRAINITKILIVSFRQFVIYFIVIFAFLGMFKRQDISRLDLFLYFLTAYLIITVFKIISHFIILKFRSDLGENTRRVVVIGLNKKSKQLIDIFNTNKGFGYEFLKAFCAVKSKHFLEDSFHYILKNNVDEIYCSLAELSDKQINKIIKFADNNLKFIKFIPDSKKLFTKKLHLEYLDYLPVLSLREIPLKNAVNIAIKRGFDLIFSTLVIIGILSWLYPIIAIIIRLESKGKTLFIQERTGLDNQVFNCFKFRSMKENNDANNIQATKNDNRITKIGGFLRRSSLDELPQFFNVFTGSMSVVGPRPHMLKHNELYSSSVDKYMVRLFVKPGITGLAQVKGFRGEIEAKSDIVNRVKYDIFYVENWSIFMDIKIIIQTVLNVFKGEEKAY